VQHAARGAEGDRVDPAPLRMRPRGAGERAQPAVVLLAVREQHDRALALHERHGRREGVADRRPRLREEVFEALAEQAAIARRLLEDVGLEAELHEADIDAARQAVEEVAHRGRGGGESEPAVEGSATRRSSERRHARGRESGEATKTTPRRLTFRSRSRTTCWATGSHPAGRPAASTPRASSEKCTQPSRVRAITWTG